MTDKSDFLKSLIFYPLLYDSCIFGVKLFEAFTNAQPCGFMPRQIGNMCATAVLKTPELFSRPWASHLSLIPFLLVDISLDLSFSSKGSRGS